MKLYIGCPSAGEEAAALLRKYDVEPAAGEDDAGPYLDFRWPAWMGLIHLARFQAAVFRASAATEDAKA